MRASNRAGSRARVLLGTTRMSDDMRAPRPRGRPPIDPELKKRGPYSVKLSPAAAEWYAGEAGRCDVGIPTILQAVLERAAARRRAKSGS